jgi:hypothetical protein
MLSCPKCDGPFPADFYNSAAFQPCPKCRRPAKAEAFPALNAAPTVGNAGEVLATDAESSCFYHPANRAVTVCDSCGRFLCSLCDVDLNGRHLCPGCVNTGRKKGKLKQLENRRMLYDSLALSLAVTPMLIFYLTILTAPATIYVVLGHWNAPGSVVGRGKWRFVVAFIFALLQIGGWAIGIYYFMHLSHIPKQNGAVYPTVKYTQ